MVHNRPSAPDEDGIRHELFGLIRHQRRVMEVSPMGSRRFGGHRRAAPRRSSFGLWRSFPGAACPVVWGTLGRYVTGRRVLIRSRPASVFSTPGISLPVFRRKTFEYGGPGDIERIFHVVSRRPATRWSTVVVLDVANPDQATAPQSFEDRERCTYFGREGGPATTGGLPLMPRRMSTQPKST